MAHRSRHDRSALAGRLSVKLVHRGFTLIELMIVVAIIGILATIAFPEFQTFVLRARTAERRTIMGGITRGISDVALTRGQIPALTGAWNPATPTTSKQRFDMSAPGWRELPIEVEGTQSRVPPSPRWTSRRWATSTVTGSSARRRSLTWGTGNPTSTPSRRRRKGARTPRRSDQAAAGRNVRPAEHRSRAGGSKSLCRSRGAA